jgi:4-carboxymuconolactone decarboxylase
MKATLRIVAIGLLLTGSAFALTGERMAEIPLDKMTPSCRDRASA